MPEEKKKGILKRILIALLKIALKILGEEIDKIE